LPGGCAALAKNHLHRQQATHPLDDTVLKRGHCVHGAACNGLNGLIVTEPAAQGAMPSAGLA
jgi:hypothetical protein